MNTNEPSTVRIGAIGAGSRLRAVLKLTLAEDPRLKLAAIYDPYAPSVDEARALGADAQCCDQWESIIHDPDIDWVMIGSPNRYHAQQAIAALDAGKHVFCEKPLATSFKDCLAVRDAVQRNKGLFVFGLVLRYSRHYQQLKQLLTQEDFGELISFEFNETLRFGHGGYIFGNWRRHTCEAGSHILEKTCHDLDLANWMTGSLPVRVASFGGRRFFLPKHAVIAEELGPDEQGRPAFQAWPDPLRVDPFAGDTDLLDHQVVILEYANGVRATFHTNAASGLPERRFYLCGTRGALRANVYSGEITYQPIAHNAQPNVLNHGRSDGHGGGDQIMCAALAQTMLSDKPPLTSIHEALQSAVVAFAIDQAQTTGQVVDLRPMWREAGVVLQECETLKL